ncbi:GumC family protein [Thermosynechococcus sp.]|uniref:GumC family protein n=1 Tax=Thermosynechococcus sp. TaxID=2814275 RepID=UPI00391B18EA
MQNNEAYPNNTLTLSANNERQIRDSLLQPVTAERITIGELLAVLKRRWKIAATVGCTLALTYIGYSYAFQRSYQHTFTIQVEPIRPLGAKAVSLPDATRGVSERFLSLPLLSGETTGDVLTLTQILSSDFVLKPIYQELVQEGSIDASKYSYPSFRNSIQIGQSSKGNKSFLGAQSSKVIEIKVFAKTKEELKLLLNLIASKIIEFNEKEKQRQIEENLRYVNQEIRKGLAQIEELEDQLSAFRRTHQVLRPDAVPQTIVKGIATDADLYREQFAELIGEKSKNDSKLAALRQTFDSINSQLKLNPDQAFVASRLSSSDSYSGLLDGLMSTEKELATELSLLAPNSPPVQRLEEERRLLLSKLKKEAQRVAAKSQVANPEGLTAYPDGLLGKYLDTKVELESLQRLDAELSRQITATRAQLERLTRLANPYRKIEQRLAITQESLQLLLQTRQSLQLQIAQQDFTWRVLSDIDDPERYEPMMRLPMALLIALILGTTSGILVALLWDFLDTRFLTVDQVQQRTSLPIIAQIPLAREFDQYTFARIETPLTLWRLEDHLAEATPAFRESFYFLLSHLDRLARASTVAVTSAQAQEGRSTITAYLGLAAATVGKKVLLVDTHLRRPGLHEVFGIANTAGLAELLSGSVPLPNWSALLHNDGQTLWVLTAGQPRQNPAALLSSPLWSRFLAAAQEVFDLILLDTPPMVQSAETAQVIAAVGHTVFVVCLGRTQQKTFAQALQEYDLGFKHKVMGIVVNGARWQDRHALVVPKALPAVVAS